MLPLLIALNAPLQFVPEKATNEALFIINVQQDLMKTRNPLMTLPNSSHLDAGKAFCMEADLRIEFSEITSVTTKWIINNTPEKASSGLPGRQDFLEWYAIAVVNAAHNLCPRHLQDFKNYIDRRYDEDNRE